MGFPVLGGEGEGAYAMRPYLAGRKKDHLFGFFVLGGADEGVYAIRPYTFGMKRDQPLDFPAPEKDGIQKCTP